MTAIRRSKVAAKGVQVTLLLLLACSLQAQERQSPAERKGAWDLSVWVAGATGEETRNSFAQAQVWTAGVFLGRTLTGEVGKGWRRGSLEYGFNVIPVFVQSRTETVYGGGFEPAVLRWNSGRRIGRVWPYIELAGGGIFTTSNVPPGQDTSGFNFTARGGGGIQIFTSNRRSWNIGCHWAHVSNANLGDFNPEFNGVQVTLGYHWFK